MFVTRPGIVRCGVGLAVGTLVLAAPEPARAQDPGQAQVVDSTALRIMERLRRLGRAPGFDSILFVQDSIALETARLRRPGSGGGQADSVAAFLLDMPGYTLTEYQAAEADFGAASRELLLLSGEGERARVTRDGNTIEADSSIVYSEASGRVRTAGQSTLTPATGDPLETARLIYDLSQGRGSAYDANTSYRQGSASWNVRGDMPFAAPDSMFMSHARFTSCELEEPHYHFETDQIKIVGNKVLIARPVRLYFADVPVAWLPFIAQSLSEGRASGLLTPRFSVNDIVRTSGGYRRRVSNIGYYWAMSDYSDALVSMDWFSETFFSLTSSVQYVFNRKFLQGDLNFRRYWRTDGSTELALDTRHSWDLDERTQLRASGRYASSNDFVRENSFNPREVTQSIDSEGGLNRRFGWGSLSAGANRKQFLSDDRTEWTLPSVNLSLSTITLFPAPSIRAGAFNNMTWAGSGNLSRRTIDRVQPDTFAIGLANTATTTGALRSNLSLGKLTFSQSVEVSEAQTLGVPEALLLLPRDSLAGATFLTGDPARDITNSELSWSSSVNFQQNLIGSTTLTPRLSMSGRMFKSDTSDVARNYVAGPARVALGVELKTDIYGQYPGFGGFEAVRHKITPSFGYDWSPEKTPTQLQRDVFGSRALQPRSALQVTLNQTWEAKRAAPESADSAAAPAAGPARAPGEPRRMQQAQTVSLLALRTSAVRYDFVQADTVGSFLAGFETVRLTNQISSDYLRGLSVSLDHELFEDTQLEGGGTDRSFAPHLSSVNLSFSLGSSSSIFRWLGFLGTSGDGDGGAAAEEPDEDETNDPFLADGNTDESSIIPGAGGRRAAAVQPRSRGAQGGWNAQLSYSLQRPRVESLQSSKMLTGSLTLRPTEQWDLSWRTAYDVERGSFNDHTIRLSRDLHRWEANFDFLQTATGNWSFRFEVSLTDNRDLKFDYQQRNLDVGLPSSDRR